METVRLSPNGQLTDQNGNPVADVLPVLARTVALDRGCTLRSFFSLLARCSFLQKLSEFLPASLADMRNCPASGCRSDDMPGLVFGRTMELRGFPGKPRAELYCWLRGLPGESPDKKHTGADTLFSGDPPLDFLMEADREIRFVPLQFLLDTPLYLGGMKHVVLGDVPRSLFCESRFTLFEVVDGLAWELGFQGGAQQCSIGR